MILFFLYDLILKLVSQTMTLPYEIGTSAPQGRRRAPTRIQITGPFFDRDWELTRYPFPCEPFLSELTMKTKHRPMQLSHKLVLVKWCKCSVGRESCPELCLMHVLDWLLLPLVMTTRVALSFSRLRLKSMKSVKMTSKDSAWEDVQKAQA